MPAGRGDLERPPRPSPARPRRAGPGRAAPAAAARPPGHTVRSGSPRRDASRSASAPPGARQPGHQRRLGQVRRRHHDPADPGAGRRDHRRQHPAGRAAAGRPARARRAAPPRRAARPAPHRPPRARRPRARRRTSTPRLGSVAGNSASVIRRVGQVSPEFAIAARIRSLASCSAASGRPIIVTPGSPSARSAWISTSCPSTPSTATDVVRASVIRTRPAGAGRAGRRRVGGHGHHVEAQVAASRCRVPASQRRPSRADPGRLRRGHRLRRVTEGGAGAGLHLAEDQRAAVLGDDVELTLGAPPVAVERPAARRSARCRAATSSPYAPTSLATLCGIPPDRPRRPIPTTSGTDRRRDRRATRQDGPSRCGRRDEPRTPVGNSHAGAADGRGGGCGDGGIRRPDLSPAGRASTAAALMPGSLVAVSSVSVPSAASSRRCARASARSGSVSSSR